jgi:hypothetical protein
MSGIEGCLASGRPPGYAGGKTTPHSARSVDAALQSNFNQLGITNCEHKTGPNGEKIPNCTFSGRSRKMRGNYNSVGGMYGQPSDMPIRAYGGLDQLRKAGYNLQGMAVDGQPFAPPAVHPTVQPGQVVGGFSPVLRQGTKIVATDRGGR